MYAIEKTSVIKRRLENRGIMLSMDAVNTLRRAEITLHRWCEQECGDGNDYASWSIERDETTGKPYRVTYPHNGNKVLRYAVADRENGAIKRIKAICQENGLHYFYQTDPRGCALYIDKSPLTDTNYSNGVSVCE